MSTSDSGRQAYLRFLVLARESRASSKDPVLDVVEERVLQTLASVWASGDKLTVLKAMAMGEDASATTIHRRLKSLRRKGYIVLKEDESDNRVKFVLPTPVAERHFERMGRCMREALQSP